MIQEYTNLKVSAPKSRVLPFIPATVSMDVSHLIECEQLGWMVLIDQRRGVFNNPVNERKKKLIDPEKKVFMETRVAVSKGCMRRLYFSRQNQGCF